MKRAVAAALAATFLTAAAGAAASAAGPSAAGPAAGRWVITTRSDDANRVQLRLEYADRGDSGRVGWAWSSSVAPGDLGLSSERLRSPIAPVAFQIAREAGTFACTGSAGDGSGAGLFVYAPNAGFDGALAARGFGRPTYVQSLELALAGTTLAFVDQLRGSTQHGTVADLVRVVEHGVTTRYAGELAGAGYKNLPLDDLIALHDHGVSVAFVDRLKAHGYTNLSIRDLIRLHDSGI